MDLTPGIACGAVKVDLEFYVNENASAAFAQKWRAGRYEAESSDTFLIPHRGGESWVLSLEHGSRQRRTDFAHRLATVSQGFE